MSDEDYLSDEQVSQTYGMAMITLRKWRSTGRGPTYLKLGSRVRYRRSDVEKWLRSREVKPRQTA